MTGGDSGAGLAYRTVTVTAIVIALALVPLVFYFASSAVFTILGGLLAAAIFDGLARLLLALGLSRRGALALVFLLVLALLAGGALWGGVAIATQAGDLFRSVQAQAVDLIDQAQRWGLPTDANANGGTEAEGGEEEGFGALLPEPEGMVSTASTALFSVVGMLGNLFIVIFIGAFVAWQPTLYRNGLVSLVPAAKRRRLAAILDEGAGALRLWLLGSVISMATVFAVSWLGLSLVGMPYAFLLAVQAGVLAFVPTLGAFVAGIPIILAGLAESPQMALWGLGVYVLIQGVESNVTTPIVQRWASDLPPALTLGFQLLLGVLFGLPGVVLAVPILAVLLVVVRGLYVDDVLGGPYRPLTGG